MVLTKKESCATQSALPTADPSGASIAIPEQVNSVVALAPSICEALMSSLALYDQEAPYQPLIDAGVCVVCVPTSVSIENVRSDIRFLAAALSVPEEGERVVKEMDAELDRLSAIVSDIPEEERKSVYFEISPAPYLYSCGSDTYLHEMIELAGAHPRKLQCHGV